jgi:hypothetical protein
MPVRVMAMTSLIAAVVTAVPGSPGSGAGPAPGPGVSPGPAVSARAAAGAAASLQGAEQPGVDTPPFAWPLTNSVDKTCIVARGTADEEPVVKTGCDLRYVDQYWTLELADTNKRYRIQQSGSGKCLLVRGTAAETAAVQHACADFADQLWYVEGPSAQSPFMLRNANSGLCLAMRASENAAKQVTCDRQKADQFWKRGMPNPPTPKDDLAKPVYFVHGYSDDGKGIDASNYWGDIISLFRNPSQGWTKGGFTGPIGRAWTYCYYSTDTNCDLLTPGDREKSIEELGKDLAWLIYDQYSQYNVATDIVAHSMGGLVVRAALDGVQRGDSEFPRFLYVEDVVTLSTPHRGAPSALICQFQQCKEMRRNSDFLKKLSDTPRSDMLTLWTIIGMDDDLIAPVWSSVPEDMKDVQHKLIYTGDQFLPKVDAHMDMLWRTTGTYSVDNCQISESVEQCDMGNRDTYDEYSNFDPPSMEAVKASYWHGWA